MVLRSKAETIGATVATVTFTTMAMATTLTVGTAVTVLMSTTMAATITRISSLRLKPKKFGRDANAIFDCMWV